MLPSLKLLIEMHFNQCLVVLCGYLLCTVVLKLKSENIGIATVYPLGYLFFAVIGVLSLSGPFPSISIKIFTSSFILGILCRTGIDLKQLFNRYKSLCLYPFLIFIIYASFLLAHFSKEEIASGIDPWLLSERTQSYRVPDNYLQWTISNNLYQQVEFETGFNLDGKQLWSAGDRPALIAVLEATLSHLSNHRNITLYYLRVIFLASLLFFILNSILKEEFKVDSIPTRILILACIGLHPFFIINIIYTWPKMAGLAFGMMGFLLLSRVIKHYNPCLLIISGIAFSLGILSHTAALYCFFAAILYFPLSYFLFKDRNNISLKNASKLCLTLLLPIIVITQFHSRLLASATNQTNLLARVQLCRGGSFAYVTPIETVLESCKKYYESRGFSGIIEDRKESLRRAFDSRPIETLNSYFSLLKGEIEIGSYLRSLNSSLILIVPYAIGHFSLWFLSGFIVIYLISLKYPLLKFSRSSLLLPIGFSLLFAFACILAQYEEMSSHVVAFIIPLFINLGVAIELSKLSSPIFVIYCSLNIAFDLAFLLARANLI